MIDTKDFYATVGLEPPKPCAVLRGDNTTGEAPQLRQEIISDHVDRLFGERRSYLEIKRERPEHRLVLWLTLEGQSPKTIAASFGRTTEWVRNLRRQPWFQDAFCKLSAEMGRDAVQALLKGEAVPAILRTVELAKNADSDAVRLAANRELLDRFLGKPVVKAEVNTTSTVDVTVADVSTLLAERERLNQQMRANGLLTGTS